MNNADIIYERLVAWAGLYGKAFFGHKATKEERKTLNILWKASLAIAGRN